MMKTNSWSERIFQTVNAVFLVLLGIITLYPFIYIFALSLNDGFDTMKGGIYIFPRAFTIENYLRAFEDKNILGSFKISILRTGIGTIVSVILTSMLAYALARKTLPGRGIIIKYFFITTIFSGGMIPFFILLRNLNLVNHFGVYIFPAIYSFYHMLIARTFFESIPISLCESAKIDGAGELRIFFQIYMPLSMPIIATIALFTGVFHWNDWFAGSFFVSDRKLMPAATLLQNILAETTFEQSSMSDINNSMNTSWSVAKVSHTTPESLRMAFVMIITLPVVIIYPFMQKYFVKGVMLGSIKE